MRDEIFLFLKKKQQQQIQDKYRKGYIFNAITNETQTIHIYFCVCVTIKVSNIFLPTFTHPEHFKNQFIGPMRFIEMNENSFQEYLLSTANMFTVCSVISVQKAQFLSKKKI